MSVTSVEAYQWLGVVLGTRVDHQEADQHFFIIVNASSLTPWYERSRVE